jgi:20S proteasome alpha/beta subunit
VTIAIGLLAKDGIVVAADTQTGITEYLKMSQGKVALGSRLAGGKVRPAIAVAGAGNSAYFEALWQSEVAHFHSLEPKFDFEIDQFEQGLRQRLEEFYTKHVIPFALYSAAERPDLSLIIATQNAGGKRRLWYTEKNLLIPSMHHGAIGIGAMYARILLGKTWAHYLDLGAALLLAAYVVYHTKQHVDGCGEDTTMAYLGKDATWVIDPAVTEEIDRIYKEHVQFESEALHYAILARHGSEKEIAGKLSRIRERLQKAISKVDLGSR